MTAGKNGGADKAQNGKVRVLMIVEVSAQI